MSDATAATIMARKLRKHYEAGRVRALDDLDLEIAAGAFVAICGPSGCGKTTLLNMLAGIDRPDDGALRVGELMLSELPDRSLVEYRRSVVGLVFQLHNLLPNLTAVENVQVPMLGTRLSAREQHDRACALLDQVGLAARSEALPSRLSGGERQRVAIARAMANNPRVILADEPTGALDSENGRRLLDLLEEVRREHGTTLIVVTHDPGIAQRADTVLNMLDGRIAGMANSEQRMAN